jgi:hypothetical protein
MFEDDLKLVVAIDSGRTPYEYIDLCWSDIENSLPVIGTLDDFYGLEE